MHFLSFPDCCHTLNALHANLTCVMSKLHNNSILNPSQSFTFPDPTLIVITEPDSFMLKNKKKYKDFILKHN